MFDDVMVLLNIVEFDVPDTVIPFVKLLIPPKCCIVILLYPVLLIPVPVPFPVIVYPAPLIVAFPWLMVKHVLVVLMLWSSVFVPVSMFPQE